MVVFHQILFTESRNKRKKKKEIKKQTHKEVTIQYNYVSIRSSLSSIYQYNLYIILNCFIIYIYIDIHIYLHIYM